MALTLSAATPSLMLAPKALPAFSAPYTFQESTVRLQPRVNHVSLLGERGKGIWEPKSLVLRSRRSDELSVVARASGDSQRSTSEGLLPQFSGDNLGTKVVLGALWAAYMWFVLLTPNAPGLPAQAMDPNALKEAFELSVNFWFVLPLALPQLAPVIHPAFEGMFEALVTWSVLYFGFITEARNQKTSTLGFFIGSSFLTNIFYIPYLAIRRSSPSLQPRSEPNPTLDTVETLVENKFFGPICGGLGAFAIAWGLFARPEFGNLATRGAEFVRILKTDRLAYSFLVDMGIFALLQSWMVPDDMRRRGFEDPKALWATRLLPFFGLAYYMAIRPPLPLSEDAAEK